MELKAPRRMGWRISDMARECGLSRTTVDKELASPGPRSNGLASSDATSSRKPRTRVAFALKKRMGQRILVIGPNDSVDRIARVAQALAARRPDLSPTTPAEILGGEQDWPGAYHKAPRVAAAVVCVPRGDATVGSGTLHDLVEAHEAAVPVRVVSPRGRLLGLEEAGLEVIPKPRTNDAVRVWKKRAAWFSWRARALPTIFGAPRPGNC